MSHSGARCRKASVQPLRTTPDFVVMSIPTLRRRVTFCEHELSSRAQNGTASSACTHTYLDHYIRDAFTWVCILELWRRSVCCSLTSQRMIIE